MKWLTLDYIKQHSRIDFTCEDAELELLGEAAEDSILELCDRTKDEFVETYGKVPPKLYLAGLMLTEHFYTHRGVVVPGNLSVVPYSIDLLIKNYMKLT